MIEEFRISILVILTQIAKKIYLSISQTHFSLSAPGERPGLLPRTLHFSFLAIFSATPADYRLAFTDLHIMEILFTGNFLRNFYCFFLKDFHCV